MHPYATYPSLVDRPVLISGGATGIGAEMVKQFAVQGARVAFIDIDERAGTQLADMLGKVRHAPVFGQTDVTDLAALETLLAPAHVARVALFLASDDGEMCPAQEFIVDSGWA